MATYDLTQTTPAKLQTGDIINVPYSGTYKAITLPKGVYKLEVWGAQGGSYSSYYGGKGGYSYGTLTLEEDTTLNCYAGGQPATNSSSRVTTSGGYNGGGKGFNRYYSSTYTYGQGGGGGSDIRINSTSLYARIIVAGGGGGSASVDAQTTKYGGGTSGGSPQSGYGASQTGAGTNGSFGTGGAATTSGNNYKYGSGGGGGGWYGGGACTDYSDSTNYRGYNGGGSGYVYTSSTASNYPSGCLLNSAYYLTDAATVAGNASFTDYSGSTVTGHSGNGYVRITVIEIKKNFKIKTTEGWKDGQECYVKTNDNTWKVAQSVYVKATEDLTVLDYIESTGTQYINTEFIPTQDSYVKIKFSSENPGNCVLGCDVAWGDDGLAIGCGYAEFADTVTNTGVNFSVSANVMYEVELTSEGKLYVNGSLVWTATKTTFTTSCPLTLFCLNRSGGTREFSSVKIYSCQIYDNDTLVRDYVPVLDSSGVTCLYDKVTNQLFYNAGTGEFIAGYKTEFKPEIELPFLASTGTQYIDTGFIPNQDTRVVCRAIYTHDSTSTYLFGSDGGSNIDGFAFGSATSMLRLFYNDASTYFDSTLSFTKPITIDVNKNVATINDTYSVSGTYAEFNSGSSIYLFGDNRAGTLYGAFGARIYYCKIYDNNVLVRDYIPKTDNNGTPALFDKVSQTYFYNQGTGTFNAGTVLKRSYWKQVA